MSTAYPLTTSGGYSNVPSQGASLWSDLLGRLAGQGVELSEVAGCDEGVLSEVLKDLGFSALQRARLQTEWRERLGGTHLLPLSLNTIEVSQALQLLPPFLSILSADAVVSPYAEEQCKIFSHRVHSQRDLLWFRPDYDKGVMNELEHISKQSTAAARTASLKRSGAMYFSKEPFKVAQHLPGQTPLPATLKLLLCQVALGSSKACTREPLHTEGYHSFMVNDADGARYGVFDEAQALPVLLVTVCVEGNAGLPARSEVPEQQQIPADLCPLHVDHSAVSEMVLRSLSPTAVAVPLTVPPPVSAGQLSPRLMSPSPRIQEAVHAVYAPYETEVAPVFPPLPAMFPATLPPPPPVPPMTAEGAVASAHQAGAIQTKENTERLLAETNRLMAELGRPLLYRPTLPPLGPRAREEALSYNEQEAGEVDDSKAVSKEEGSTATVVTADVSVEKLEAKPSEAGLGEKRFTQVTIRSEVSHADSMPISDEPHGIEGTEVSHSAPQTAHTTHTTAPSDSNSNAPTWPDNHVGPGGVVAPRQSTSAPTSRRTTSVQDHTEQEEPTAHLGLLQPASRTSTAGISEEGQAARNEANTTVNDPTSTNEPAAGEGEGEGEGEAPSAMQSDAPPPPAGAEQQTTIHNNLSATFAHSDSAVQEALSAIPTPEASAPIPHPPLSDSAVHKHNVRQTTLPLSQNPRLSSTAKVISAESAASAPSVDSTMSQGSSMRDVVVSHGKPPPPPRQTPTGQHLDPKIHPSELIPFKDIDMAEVAQRGSISEPFLQAAAPLHSVILDPTENVSQPFEGRTVGEPQVMGTPRLNPAFLRHEKKMEELAAAEEQVERREVVHEEEWEVKVREALERVANIEQLGSKPNPRVSHGGAGVVERANALRAEFNAQQAEQQPGSPFGRSIRTPGSFGANFEVGRGGGVGVGSGSGGGVPSLLSPSHLTNSRSQEVISMSQHLLHNVADAMAVGVHAGGMRVESPQISPTRHSKTHPAAVLPGLGGEPLCDTLTVCKIKCFRIFSPPTLRSL